MRFELTTLTLARLCSTPELRPRANRCRSDMKSRARLQVENPTSDEKGHLSAMPAAADLACGLDQVPAVAERVAEDGDRAIGFVARRFFEDDPACGHRGVVLGKVVGV